MPWKDQIVVEPIKENTGDMFIVNCARVSHNKWKTEFDEKDQGLLNFLARSEPPHKTPFRHARHCFRIPQHQLWFLDHIKDIMVADPFMAAGIIIKDNSIALSVLSMVNLIYTDHFLPQFVGSNLIRFLVTNYPGVHKAFQLPEMDLRFEVSPLVERKAKDKWLNNLSFRCTAPIWLTRQLVKHQVGLSWNEVSRRYVSDGVELFNQEFRLRAENVKQGSGEVVHPNCVSSIDISDEHSMDHRLNEQAMLRWYNRCVDPKQDNLAPETIRGYMPLNMMTTWIWSGPQAAFENMVHLREESHAQVEAQVFAQKMKAAILDGQDF